MGIDIRSFVLVRLSIHSKLVQYAFIIVGYLIKSKNKLLDITFNSPLTD